MHSLYGLTAVRKAQYALIEEPHRPARVVQENKTNYQVISSNGMMTAMLQPRLAREAVSRLEYPVVGDWICLDQEAPVITQVLPRTSLFVRQAAGSAGVAQPVAANIDTLCIVTGLDHDLSINRIERIAAIAWESGASPVAILTKADLRDDTQSVCHAVAERCVGLAVIALSSYTGDGLQQLDAWLTPGSTVALVGSSGAGKSTLLNALMHADVQRTAATRAADSKGRHTTTARSLLMLPNGSLIIDTPGMREIGVWQIEALDEAFPDIESLAAHCRFADCRHESEPGCAVRQAVTAGHISSERWQSFSKLHKEAQYQRTKADYGAAAAERARWKSITKQIRSLGNNK